MMAPYLPAPPGVYSRDIIPAVLRFATLSALTGVTGRTVYRNLPPYGPESNRSRKRVEAFELAARKLANLD
jgi:hypothetical protein